MNEEQLINIIRDYPFLYLMSDKNYHNLQMKEIAWEKISSEMEMPVEDCKERWKKLKDCYRKAKAKKQGKIGSSADCITKKWKYEDEMSFLLPNLKERPQKPSIDHIDVLTDEVKIEYEDGESSIGTQDGTSSNISIGSKRKRLPKPEFESTEVLLENEEKRKTSDHLTKFFESAEETTRCLPHELQIEVKHRISMILYEFELKAMQDSRLNADDSDDS